MMVMDCGNSTEIMRLFVLFFFFLRAFSIRPFEFGEDAHLLYPSFLFCIIRHFHTYNSQR